jgi:hypothetical protein
LILTGGISFNSNSNELSPVIGTNQIIFKPTLTITFSPTKTSRPTIRPSQTSTLTVASTIDNLTQETAALIPATGHIVDSPTPTPVIFTQADPRSENDENVLLLTVSYPVTNFDETFTKLTDYYGMQCRRIALDKVPLTAKLLHKVNGNYYRLIVIDAAGLLRKPPLLSNADIWLLRSVMGSGGVNFLISGVNDETDSSALAMLTGQAIQRVVRPVDNHRDWAVSEQVPELTQLFTGQRISPKIVSPQQDYALQTGSANLVIPVITSKDESGQDYTILGWIRNGAISIFINAAESSYSLEVYRFEDLYYSIDHFSQIIPLMLAIRYAMGDEAWHSTHQYANLTIDEGALIEPFGNLNYAQLYQEMVLHNFHTTIAFPPINYTKSQSEVVDLFKEHPDRFSLVQNGNNDDGYEFYRYATSVLDPIPARPFIEQDASIIQGLERMQQHQKMTGIPFDQIMIFPDGISPEPTFNLLKKYNYLATINSEEIPLDADRPTKWDFGMYPANLDYGNFPSLVRRHLETSTSFSPEIELCIMDIFIGKPALFYSYQYELFNRGIGAFDQVADQMNQLPENVEWRSLGYIVTHLYLEKSNDDQSFDIKMFTNDLVFTNESYTAVTYHVTKAETFNVSISSLTVNGDPFSYRAVDGQLKLDITVQAKKSIEIKILYQE